MVSKHTDIVSKEKKNRKGILLTDKVKIIHDLENGIAVQEIMKKYRIRSRSTIYTIRKSKVKIMNNIANIHGNIAHRKNFKQAPSYPKVDEALYLWFLQQRQRHIPVSQEMLQIQSVKFVNELEGESHFGSRGYIDKFIKRYEIRLLKITGEKLSSNMAAIEDYIKKFSTGMQIETYARVRLLTYVDKNSVGAPGKKTIKERLTFMPCSNMDGTLKLPLMVIGKYLNPRSLKNMKELPVNYTTSKNAWMTQSGLPIPLFNAEELKTSDGAISTMFLLPNKTAAYIQPMDQNVIQMIKSRYRKIMMREIFGRSGITPVGTLKNLSENDRRDRSE
ncbi:jerky protein homolog-like [Toxorhynchites rutilus septentrionalis]|uniref:jerky protein homolog-like n=1 Tax=Toxorhynchites rutilus septentrionalis TaxID=329112 RepID=UPI002479F007|nr:jerky protein homolog-like [Toxorhynchites rutilus septentrionalis]